MQGIIYLVTNKITGEMYVGQTIKTLKQRWSVHCAKSRCRKLSMAIEKYGKDQFYIDQIDLAKTISELNMKEIYWIQKLNTLSPNGYNLQTGSKYCGISIETKEILSNLSKGNKYALGNILSEETRKKMSLRAKNMSDETKAKMSKSKMGLKCSESTKLKISQTRKERKIQISETTKSECLKVLIGNKFRLGKFHSEEVKAKMRKSQHKKGPDFGKYKGVIFVTKQQRFRAMIYPNGKSIYLGSFKNEVDAAKAYDKAALFYYGENCYLNFPF